jgi:hypothetical protein
MAATTPNMWRAPGTRPRGCIRRVSEIQEERPAKFAAEVLGLCCQLPSLHVSTRARPAEIAVARHGRRRPLKAIDNRLIRGYVTKTIGNVIMSSTITNAEKQARFRKKEELRKLAERFFREWQVMAIHSKAQPRNVLKLLSDAAELPSGWTDEQYNDALQKLHQLRTDLIGSQNYVENDVHEAMDIEHEFIRSTDAGKLILDTKRAVNDAHSLAAHLISALELSRCNDAGKAAAIMEVMRHVGRSIANSSNVAKSSATTVCLAALPCQYVRPTWFVPKLAQWLAYQLDEDLARDLGKQLLNFDYEAFP